MANNFCRDRPLNVFSIKPMTTAPEWIARSVSRLRGSRAAEGAPTAAQAAKVEVERSTHERLQATLRRGNEALIQIINTLPPASAEHQSTGHGMALDNVKARLSLLHDLQGSFSAKVRDGLYVVRLSVPLQQSESKPGQSRHAHSDR